jgi:nitrate reductase NapE component
VQNQPEKDPKKVKRNIWITFFLLACVVVFVFSYTIIGGINKSL